MPLYLGDSGNQPSRIYAGNTRINRVYRGETRIWPPRQVRIGWPLGGRFYSVDPVSGTFTTVATTWPVTGNNAGPVVDVDGTLYGVIRDATGTVRLYSVNPSTGAWTALRIISFGGSRPFITWAAYDGTTFFIGDRGRAYEVNLSTGVATDRGAFSTRLAGGAGGNRAAVWADSRFIALGSGLNQPLHSFTVSAGSAQNTATLLGLLPATVGTLTNIRWVGIGWDPDSSTLYAIAATQVFRPGGRRDPEYDYILYPFTVNVAAVTPTRLGTASATSSGNSIINPGYAAVWLD